MQRLPSNPASLGAAQQTQGLSKIVITQIFVLLGTINQEKDKAKRETQSEQINGMISQYGMDVFPKFFRRALVLNADHIFNSNPTQQGSYELLLKYVQKIRTDPDEADNVAQSIDTTEGDLFKNFDVSKFMDHFKLDPIAKTMLALSLKTASKSDLRTKANAVLTNQFQNLLMSIVHPSADLTDDLPIPYLHRLLDRLIHRPPPSWSEENRNNLQFAVRSRFEKLGIDIPIEIQSIFQLAEVMTGNNPLIKVLSETGPRGSSTIDECKEMLAHIETRDATFAHVANALLYMLFSQDVEDSSLQYDPSVFVAALRDHRAGKRLDWQDVVGAFDRPGLVVTKVQFLALYNALLPLAQEYENFDIQLLWGGNWTNLETQLSFVVAFLSCNPKELDASAIPRLRSTYQLDQFDDASDDVKKYAAEAVKYPFVSLDAVKALFNMIFQSQEAYSQANFLGIPDTIINPHTELFTLAIAAVPQPWNTLQTQAFAQLFVPFLNNVLSTAAFVMHGLWKRDHIWLIYRLVEIYQRNPMDLDSIYYHAQQQGWIPTLTSIGNEFGVDLAALAHKHDNLNLQEYLESSFRQVQVNQGNFPAGLARYLEGKARNELNLQRGVPGTQQSVSLSLGTVAEFLDFLFPMVSEDTHLQLLKICITAYPRLINYGEGFDEILNTNCEKGHQLSEEADNIMQEKFRTLYNNEITVRDMIEDLQRFKQSEDGPEQDIFAALIKNLFDEYSCFSEYPLEALSHTAVMFGGVISYKLINRLALQLAMAMVLDALHNSDSREDKMYKFGLQALKQFQGRLHEWPRYCEQLIKIELLKATDIWTIAEEVTQNKGGKSEIVAAEKGDNPGPIANGGEDHAETGLPNFTCIFPDPPVLGDFYEMPSEDVQDKVLFVLNNVSPANVEEKQGDLRQVLEHKHHLWFAEYLVDQRAKLQANFQGLYLTLLELFGDDTLLDEVLRETYVSIARVLNSEATLNSSTEKTHLKSLGSWLGSLTLARDIPIKLRNLSFRDLLIQAHATQRLAIVIPFTAKVLVEAGKSELFQPPNPWTIDILKLLLELYHFAELRINLKFEIETLCNQLKFDMKQAEPASIIRDSMAITVEDDYEDALAIAETMEPFPEMGILASRPRAHRGSFSPSTLADSLPDVSQRLVYPPHSSSVVTNDQLRQIFSSAAQQAITEIIFPVVERSVTIAAIAAGQLVVKDFATEPDETKFRNAAHQVVKHLSGCLAMVTCREPLRMSMSNHVRAISRSYHDNIPEGVILMFVNDNLDTVCRVIEEAAEKYSIAEIENQIREAVSMRQVHASGNSDRPFNWPPSSNYSFIIPEPYKLTPGGLRPEQLAIYENFGTSGSGHLLASHEARQQMQDVGLHEQYTAVPNLPAPTEGPGALRQAPQQRLVAPPVSNSAVQSQLNGYNEQPSMQDRLEGAFVELLREAREAPEDRIVANEKNSRLREAFQRVIDLLEMAGSQLDNVALFFANQIPGALFQESARRLEVEVLVSLLNELCRYSMNAARNIIIWLASLDDDLLNPAVTVSLVGIRLMEIQRVDGVLAKALNASKERAILCLDELVDHLLLSDHPLAIRSNLASSFEALVQWIQREPDLESANAILKKLQTSALDMTLEPGRATIADEICHVFDEWVQLHRPDMADKPVASFVRQLHELGMLKSFEQLTTFLRTCFELSIIAYEQDHSAMYKATEHRYIHIDALAALVVALTVYQANQLDDGEVHLDRTHFFESILSISILFQCDHYRTRGEDSNQKIFFRFYSTLLSEIHTTAMPAEQTEELYLALSRAFLAMQPSYLPGFVFGWLGLVSHRRFIGTMLTMSNETANDRYLELLQVVFDVAGKLSTVTQGSGESPISSTAREFYEGALRLTVVIFHDFQDFLVQNHFRLCNNIPDGSVQLKNLVLSAVPSESPEYPYPFQPGMKPEAVDGMLDPPVIRNDFELLLKDSKLTPSLKNLLESNEPSPTSVNKLYQSIRSSEPPSKKRISIESHQQALIHAVVLYIFVHAVQTGTGEIYNKAGPHASVLRLLSQVLNLEDRVHFVDAIVNQLRFPNAHTLFSLHAVLDLFSDMPPASLNNNGDDSNDPDTVMELIVRMLLDRLAVNRPHPWGVIVALSELYKSSEYAFWDLPFIKNTPEVERLFNSLRLEQ